VKNIDVRTLKRLRLYGIATIVVGRLLARWRSIQPWGEPARQRRERNLHTRIMSSFYSSFVKKGDLCFDVGANVGQRTEVFRRLGATVVAVEPQDVCVKQLMKKYKKRSRVKIVPKALGDKEGETEMFLSNAHTISSLSKGWIDSVKASGRFAEYTWNKEVIVPVTTLDKLIEEHGQPAFCKIDVEGFEFEVLKGLSQPMKVVSIEFTPEFIDSTVNSINRLSSLGMIWFNYSVGESMVLSLGKWVKADEMCDILGTLPVKTIFGDVYATSTTAPGFASQLHF
jgi:FkbM family methyltransferase